ncbi:MAG: hypothetical protein HXY25_04420 [Alphaproteobacteria bacterium]|nr:hypothetical protein [Alphaproteobacteria bacterium]
MPEPTEPDRAGFDACGERLTDPPADEARLPVWLIEALAEARTTHASLAGLRERTRTIEGIAVLVGPDLRPLADARAP